MLFSKYCVSRASPPVYTANPQTAPTYAQTPPVGVQQEVTIPRLPEEKDVQPVDHDYIEEIKYGKVVSFSCKLCDVRFNDLNDPNAKERHMKVKY